MLDYIALPVVQAGYRHELVLLARFVPLVKAQALRPIEGSTGRNVAELRF